MFCLSTFIEQFLKAKDDSWTKDDQDEADELMALWVGGTVLPLSLVENDDFKAYVKKLNPKVSVFFTRYRVSQKKISQ